MALSQDGGLFYNCVMGREAIVPAVSTSWLYVCGFFSCVLGKPVADF
jgi:hypothetical protein